jgi:hypothetical protein
MIDRLDDGDKEKRKDLKELEDAYNKHYKGVTRGGNVRSNNETIKRVFI